MIETIVIEFEKVTKYPMLDFLRQYQDFMLNSYSAINSYYSGQIESIDNEHLIALSQLTSECKNVLSYFKNFANKFATCGYWELMDYVETLNTNIEKINKLPKFRRTSLTKKGYMPYVQVQGSVGSFRTMEDVANSVKQLNQDNTNWIDLQLSNDMNEIDWEIDKLTPINVFVNNQTDIVVTTILDQPIGVRIYGRDIARKIKFVTNDVEIKSYQDNIEQKCEILLGLNRGDVPENMLFGKNMSLIAGVTVKQFAYPALVQDIQETFLQDDLFEYVNITDFNFNDGSIEVTCEIKTKYDYKTEKKIVI
mgnify:CR=1 FL=1|jgi:hypothetical protein|nr:MAG TPA: Pvc1, Pvc9, Pvc11, Pvc12, Pvc4, Photorhabdus asymbiotica, PVC, contractile.5A [Caudoviricetes sp.]